MKGVTTVFLHEWAGFRRGGVAALLLSIVSVIGIAVAVGEHRLWNIEQRERTLLQAKEAEQWLALGDTHIHKAAHRGYFIIRAIPPGAILDRGVWDFGGSAIWLEAHRRNAPKLRAADASGLILRGIPRGVGPVLLWIIPLLLAVLVHGVVAGERARGTLAFAVSSGASPAVIVAGKALAVMTLAWAAAAAPILAGAGLALQSGLSFTGAIAWALTTLSALGVFSILVVTVSSVMRRPLGALVALLLIWFAMAVLWPRLASGVTAQLVPIPSSQTVRSTAEVAAEGLVSDATERAVRERLAADGVLEPNPSGVSAMAAEIDAAKAFTEIFAPLENAMKRQSDLFDVLSWASPLSAADRAADAALGLSDRHQFSFEARAEAMRIATQMALNEQWARSSGSARGTPETWSRVVAATRTIAAPATGPGYAGAGIVIWVFLSLVSFLFAARAVRDSI